MSDSVRRKRAGSLWRGWAPWRRASRAAFLLVVIGIAARAAFTPETATVEATCPFGAIESAWSLATSGTWLRNVGPGGVLTLGLVLLVSLVFGRVFCSWACPIGTIEDILASISRRLFGKRGPYPLHIPAKIDRPLRWLKLVVLVTIIWASLHAVAPPLAPFCPYRTLFDWQSISMLGIGILIVLISASLMIERFWCRYLCPLGAILAPLNRVSPFRPRVNLERCVSCSRCRRACPAGIDPVADGTQHPECVRCYACVDACSAAGSGIGAMRPGGRTRTPVDRG